MWEHWDQCGSTMDQARGALERHRGKRYVVVSCRRQTQGRGTKERRWLSPAGNVYMTMAVHKSKFVRAREFLLPLETALVTAQTIEGVAGLRGRVQLKWPNDVVIEGKKVSGCLIEDAGEYRLIGIGINVQVAPEVWGCDGGTTLVLLPRTRCLFLVVRLPSVTLQPPSLTIQTPFVALDPPSLMLSVPLGLCTRDTRPGCHRTCT